MHFYTLSSNTQVRFVSKMYGKPTVPLLRFVNALGLKGIVVNGFWK